MSNINYKKKEIAFFFLTLVLISFYIVLATMANSNLTIGRFALFMDERITFDGVHHILHPDGLKDFILSIIHGGDHRYGRSLWYSIAIFSFLPEHFYGESGQIIADRMAQVVILIFADILLTLTFIKDWGLRFLLLATLLAMPYSDYYMSMPKPEPLQLLFIAAFLYYFKKNEMGLQGWYWIFLGLAFGSKISALPFICIFLLASFIKYFSEANSKKYIFELSSTFGFFLIGLMIAEPMLAPQISMSFIIFQILKKILTKKYPDKQWVIGISVIIVLVTINFIISMLLFYRFQIKSPINVWIQSTFLSTRHGADLSNIGFNSWVSFFLNDWMVAPASITIGLIAIATIVTINIFLQRLKPSGTKNTLNNAVPLVIMMSGIAMNLLIFSTTQRLWGMYLYLGTSLSLVGLIAIFENQLLIKCTWLDKSANMHCKLNQYSSFLGLLLIIVITFYWWMPNSFNKYNALANRTKSLEYHNQYNTYIEVIDFLTNYPAQQNKYLNVSFDARLFLPASTKRYIITEFFESYISWASIPDIIIYGKTHTAKGHNQPINSPRFKAYLKEHEWYLKYVINKNEKCPQTICFVRQMTLSEGGEILALYKPIAD